jgi:prepilin-type processing-associated H-X9-DG protein
MDDGYFLYPYAINAYDGLNWVNVPGFRHANGTVWSFADGHSAHKKWRTPRAQVVGDMKRNSPADFPGERAADMEDLEMSSPQNPVNL